MNQLVKDRLKQEIKVGDYVVCRLSGRSGKLEYGKVTKITVETDAAGQPVLDRHGNVQPTAHVRLANRYAYSFSQNPNLGIAAKDSRLTNTEAMAVYPTMPQEVIDLFQDAGL
jgi:hypothetical protein